MYVEVRCYAEGGLSSLGMWTMRWDAVSAGAAVTVTIAALGLAGIWLTRGA